jgi:hypothetical protein
VPGISQLKKAQMIRNVAAPALSEAGYRERTPQAQENRAAQLLGMPRVQAAIMERMAANGVSLDSVAAKLAEIIDSPMQQEKDGPGTPPDTVLRAIDLFFKTTTGYATTKSVNLHGGSKQMDKFFNPELFASPGDPELTIDQE